MSSSDIPRRRLIQGALIGSVSVSGCLSGDSTSTQTPPEEMIKVSPKNPRVGKKVTLDISEDLLFYISNRSENEDVYNIDKTSDLLYFWSLSSDGGVDSVGRTTTARFDRAGQQVIQLLLVHKSVFDSNANGYNSVSDLKNVIRAKSNIDQSDNFDLYNRQVSVQEAETNPLRLDGSRVEVFLKTKQKNVPIDSSATLLFSAANESTDGETLRVTLRLEVPTNLTLSATSFDGGGGQFISTFEAESGEVASESISLSATEPGSYEIRAEATYELGNGDPKTADRSMIIRFYD